MYKTCLFTFIWNFRNQVSHPHTFSKSRSGFALEIYGSFHVKSISYFQTLTKTGKGRQSRVEVSNTKFDENTCRLASVVTGGQTERRGEPKRRVCVTYTVRGAKYTRMNQHTQIRKIKLEKKYGEKEIHLKWFWPCIVVIMWK